MHEEPRKKKLPLVGILAVLLLVLLVSVVGIAIATATVSGSATLPNGSSIGITTRGLGFGVSSSQDKTRIEAGGYVVVVDDDLKLMVNGKAVATLDDEPKNYQLTVDADGLRITCKERTVAHVE